MIQRFFIGDIVKYKPTGDEGEVLESGIAVIGDQRKELVAVLFEGEEENKVKLADECEMIRMNIDAVRIAPDMTLMDFIRMGGRLELPNGVWLQGSVKTQYIAHGTKQTPGGLGAWHMNDQGFYNALETIEEQLAEERGEHRE